MKNIFFKKIPVVLKPADLCYHAWFPRYRHLTLFVTQQQEQELGILGVGYLFVNTDRQTATEVSASSLWWEDTVASYRLPPLQ